MNVDWKYLKDIADKSLLYAANEIKNWLTNKFHMLVQFSLVWIEAADKKNAASLQVLRFVTHADDRQLFSAF